MMRSAACSVLAACALMISVAGCAEQSNKPMSQYTRETGNERIEVRDEWRKFALANYAGELLVELPSSTNVRFLQPPTVTATRNITNGQVELMVIGEVDQTNIQQNRLRHPFFVVWRQSGGGWKLLDRQIQPGKAAPAAPKPFDAPPAAPTTVPAAVP